MWKIKHFKTLEALNRWIEAHVTSCQITILFVNNGFAVEYRKLRVIG